MSELLPTIADIARLLPLEDGLFGHATAMRGSKKTAVAVTMML